MNKRLNLIIFSIAFASIAYAQSSPFQIAIVPFNIEGLEGVQSYAYGQADGKWLIVGGRKDGLHMRQPFGAFRPAGKNTTLTVVDPAGLQVWEAPLSSLSVDLQDQLGATNMQFHQEGNYLYVIGGYGYSESQKKFTTYNKLTAVDVSATIKAIINKVPVHTYFRQISDTGFAVTGGHLKKIESTYYLIGGQKFLGRYNPMGPDHGPGFIQEYSNQVRKFNIADNGADIRISGYQVITDPEVFHRRDYNAVPQILTDGSEGITVFSGAFQPTANIPFLNSTTISSKGYVTDNSFAQYYNHYHSAVLPLYSEQHNEMHNVFFGGIAQYYDSADVLVQNDEVPFVRTIARVTRDRKGKLAEYKLPVEMPGLFGAGSEFVLLPAVPQFPNKIIKLDELQSDSTLVGHIYGGIASSLPNIFFINTNEESAASSKLFKVFVIKKDAKVKDKLNDQSNNGLQLQVFPDADDDFFLINFSIPEKETVELHISDIHGKTIKKELLRGLKAGKNSIRKTLPDIKPGDIFWVTLKTAAAKSTQKIIVEP